MDAFTKSTTPKDVKDRRATPWSLVEVLRSELRIPWFDIDVCAEKRTSKGQRYWSLEDDALSFEWRHYGEWLFMNPPFSDVTPWVERAAKFSRKHGCFVVGVVPDHRETKWWRAHIEHVATHVFMPEMRTAFLGADGKPLINPKTGKRQSSPNVYTVCPLWTPWRTGQTTYSRLKLPARVKPRGN